MENVLRKRVTERLAALGLSSMKAAKMAGQNQYAIYDLVTGKKETIRPPALIAIAGALECDPEYLAGTQAELRRV